MQVLEQMQREGVAVVSSGTAGGRHTESMPRKLRKDLT
ncbi:MAG: hypothetical protein LBP38_01680 [Desulfovibrio sp.]|nr:hypothetical protein [Desulfovibrio sp.]